MGQAWHCKACREGKLSISKACINRFVDEETGDELTKEQQDMNKVRCTDDKHTRKYELHEDSFNELCDRVERTIKKMHLPEPPCKNKNDLLICLRKHNSLSRCEREMKDYIECVDTMRIRRIKEHIEQDRLQKRMDIDCMFN